MTSAPRLLYAIPLALACTSSRGDVFSSQAPTDVSTAGTSSIAGSHGASAGSGGAANAAGNSGAAGTAATGTAGAGCAAAIYCTGFESTTDTLGQIGTGTTELVTSPVHGGSSALRVSVAGADDWARFELPLNGLNHVGLRLWVMLDASATDFGVSEVHVLATLHPGPEAGIITGDNKVSIDLEAGYQLKLTETITPDKKHSDSPLTPGDWHCLQLEVSGPAGMEQATFDMDGTRRAATTASPSVVIPGGFESLYVGIEYSTGATPVVLYYDDIVIGETAAPCNE